MLSLLTAAAGRTPPDAPGWPELPELFFDDGDTVHTLDDCTERDGIARPVAAEEPQYLLQAHHGCWLCATTTLTALARHPAAGQLVAANAAIELVLEAERGVRTATYETFGDVDLADLAADPATAPDAWTILTRNPHKPAVVLLALSAGIESARRAESALAAVPATLRSTWLARAATARVRLERNFRVLRQLLDDVTLQDVANDALGQPAVPVTGCGWVFLAPAGANAARAAAFHLELLWPGRVTHADDLDRLAARIPTAYALAFLGGFGYGEVLTARAGLDELAGCGPQSLATLVAETGQSGPQAPAAIATALRLWTPGSRSAEGPDRPAYLHAGRALAAAVAILTGTPAAAATAAPAGNCTAAPAPEFPAGRSAASRLRTAGARGHVDAHA